VTVDGIRNQHRRHNLVASTGDGNANDGTDVPPARGRVLRLHQEDAHPDNGEHEAGIAQPQPVFRRGPRAALLRLPVHPQVTQASAQLLAHHRAEDDAEELEAQLLCVEVEFLAKELRQLDRDENRAEEERHRVRDGGDEDARLQEEGQGVVEVVQRERAGVQTPEVEVLFPGARGFMRNTTADVSRFGTEEDVEEELDPVDLESVNIRCE
jgi:hypothetical protein